MHRLMNMSKLKITESALKRNNLLYIKESIEPVIKGLQALCVVQEGKNRVELNVDVSSDYFEILKQ